MIEDDKRQLFFDKLSAEIEQMKLKRYPLTKDDAIRALLPNSLPPKPPRGFKAKTVAIIQKGISHCFYCRQWLKPGTIDHIIPTSKKGANNAYNRIYVCSGCNTLKADCTLEEFIQLVAKSSGRYKNEIYVINKIYALIQYRDEHIDFMIRKI
jgi:hypothetical protein